MTDSLIESLILEWNELKNKCNNLDESNTRMWFKIRQIERDLKMIERIAYSEYTDEEKISLLKKYFRWHTRINEILAYHYPIDYYDDIEAKNLHV